MNVSLEPKNSILYKMMIEANVPMVNRSRLIMFSIILPNSILTTYPVSSLTNTGSSEVEVQFIVSPELLRAIVFFSLGNHQL